MTEAQFAIRWSMQCGVVTIPKSSNAERIKEVQSAKALSLLVVSCCNVHFKWKV